MLENIDEAVLKNQVFLMLQVKECRYSWFQISGLNTPDIVYRFVSVPCTHSWLELPQHHYNI